MVAERQELRKLARDRELEQDRRMYSFLERWGENPL
jgi:hypothetical protein